MIGHIFMHSEAFVGHVSQCHMILATLLKGKKKYVGEYHCLNYYAAQNFLLIYELVIMSLSHSSDILSERQIWKFG